MKVIAVLKHICAQLLVVMYGLLSLPALANEMLPVPDHQDWNTLLKKYVITMPDEKSTQVDYVGLAHEAAKLNGYLQSLSVVDPASFNAWNKADQLAFLINAYNAWTVKLIIDNYASIKSIKDIGNLFQSPWKKEFIPLLGKTRSLDDIEHGLIRGSNRYQEPRVHFAANCASIGCPALREEAYVGNKLDNQLEQQTQRFLADKTRNRLEGKYLKVSSIFKWYREDFEKGWHGANTLADFFVLYAKPLGLQATDTSLLQKSEISIDYLNYDWRLNRK
jgi:hypothetical protein